MPQVRKTTTATDCRGKRVAGNKEKDKIAEAPSGGALRPEVDVRLMTYSQRNI